MHERSERREGYDAAGAAPVMPSGGPGDPRDPADAMDPVDPAGDLAPVPGEADPAGAAVGDVLEVLTLLDGDLVTLRRDVHRNPELAWGETRTTKLVGDRLTRAGMRARPLGRTGLAVDIGAVAPRIRIGLRADLDALPLQERTDLPFASRHHGIAHACGHDVHTVGLLGAALALHHRRSHLEEAGIAVRCLFQPAEEVMPGGGHLLHGSPFVSDLDLAFAMHCDPSRDVGTIGLREGPITAAGDAVTVTVTGRGGHSSRPHLTGDLTFALAKILTEVPAALSRRLDPRAGASLVWGAIHAGSVHNVIPEQGQVLGTLRMLDSATWSEAGDLVTALVEHAAAPYGVDVQVEYVQGVPPVVNAAAGVDAFTRAAAYVLPEGGVGSTLQSLGGEDFGWILQDVPGALARLGTRTPGGPTYDLHQGDLVVDDDAVGLAARLFATLPFVASVPDDAGDDLLAMDALR